MANYKGHLVGGFVAAAVCTAAVSLLPYQQLAAYANVLQGWQVLAGVFIVAMLFALFPDIDIKSEGQKLFYWAAFVLDVLLIWSRQVQIAAYLGLVAMVPLLSKHRGWTHSAVAAFIVPLPIIGIPYLYDGRMLPVAVILYGAAVAGYLSHLVLDGELVSRLRRLL